MALRKAVKEEEGGLVRSQGELLDGNALDSGAEGKLLREIRRVDNLGRKIVNKDEHEHRDRMAMAKNLKNRVADREASDGDQVKMDKDLLTGQKLSWKYDNQNLVGDKKSVAKLRESKGKLDKKYQGLLQKEKKDQEKLKKFGIIAKNESKKLPGSQGRDIMKTA